MTKQMIINIETFFSSNIYMYHFVNDQLNQTKKKKQINDFKINCNYCYLFKPLKYFILYMNYMNIIYVFLKLMNINQKKKFWVKETKS